MDLNQHARVVVYVNLGTWTNHKVINKPTCESWDLLFYGKKLLLISSCNSSAPIKYLLFSISILNHQKNLFSVPIITKNKLFEQTSLFIYLFIFAHLKTQDRLSPIVSIMPMIWHPFTKLNASCTLVTKPLCCQRDYKFYQQKRVSQTFITFYKVSLVLTRDILDKS
jgi:hypothetical protein